MADTISSNLNNSHGHLNSFYDKMEKHHMLHHATGGVTESKIRTEQHDTSTNPKFKARGVSVCEAIGYITATVIISGSIGGIVTYATDNYGLGALAGFAVVAVIGLKLCWLFSASSLSSSTNKNADSRDNTYKDSVASLNMEANNRVMTPNR